MATNQRWTGREKTADTEATEGAGPLPPLPTRAACACGHWNVRLPMALARGRSMSP